MTSTSHPLRIDSVAVGKGRGRIGLTFCPGKKQSDALSGAWDRNMDVDMEAITIKHFLTGVFTCATAAFTGLRQSELRRLLWKDLTGSELRVIRSVWNTDVDERTKTAASRASVPLLPALRKRLETHRNSYPQDGFIFAEPRKGSPLNLANLARRVIVPTLKDSGIEWHGWHAFRRGLGTNLYRLGVPDKDIQAVLRHANVSTTSGLYIKPVPEDAHAAMRKLEKAIGRAEKYAERVRSQP